MSNILNLMQACNAHGLYCVPLYDTLGKYSMLLLNEFSEDVYFLIRLLSGIYVLLLSFCLHIGADAIEFIICHAEVPLAFVEEKKIPEVNDHAQF